MTRTLDRVLGDLASYRSARGGYWESKGDFWFTDHEGGPVYKRETWVRHALPGGSIKAELWS